MHQIRLWRPLYRSAENEPALAPGGVPDKKIGKLDIWLDLGWSKQGALGKDKVTAIASAYVKSCASLGYSCHIYSNLDWYKNKYNPPALRALGCEFWITRYPSCDDGSIKPHLKPEVGESPWRIAAGEP